MKKKTILVAAIAVMLVAALVVGGTLAYFTDTKTADNTFTMGNVAITLDETNVAEDAPTGSRVDGNTYNVYPGQTVTKDPTVTNVGSNDAMDSRKDRCQGEHGAAQSAWPDRCCE